jgi:hypothetical protein
VQLDLDRSFDDMMKEIRALVEPDDRRGTRRVPRREPLPQHVTYENERLGALIRKLPNE